MTTADLVELASTPGTIGDASVRLDLPVGWLVDPGPPIVVTPPSWDGDPPGVVVSVERDAARGEALAAAIAHTALTRLGDPVIVSLTVHRTSADDRGSSEPLDSYASASDRDAHGDCTVSDRQGSTATGPNRLDDDGHDVEIIVAHQHRGVDVTTVERHHCRPGPARWVVGFTLAQPDVPGWLPLARRVVASLRASS